MEKINVNFWDDFFDDGFVPEGEVQKTYAYLESDLSDDDCKNVLNLIFDKIKFFKNFNNSFKNKDLILDLSFYDSAKVYPSLVGTEHECCLYKRWQLNIVNISHEMLDDLISYLESIEMEYNGSKIVVYSES